MTLRVERWASKWGVPPEAITDLWVALGAEEVVNYGLDNEDDVAAKVRSSASAQGVCLWRNNLGAYKTKTGRWVRYGLANDSKELNKILKSSDLIGIGKGGKFHARELKPSGWSYTGSDHEKAQLNFINFINSQGGDAKFSTGDF